MVVKIMVAFWIPQYNTAPNISGTSGTIILTAAHLETEFSESLGFRVVSPVWGPSVTRKPSKGDVSNHVLAP